MTDGQDSCADGPLNGYRASGEKSRDRAVAVLQEAFGVNAHIQDVTRQIAVCRAWERTVAFLLEWLATATGN